MKKIVFLFIISLLMLSACDNAPKYQIDGSIVGEMDGKTVYLNQIKGREIAKIDSAVIESGKYTFTGSVESPELYQIAIKDEKVSIFFFIENLPIAIVLDATDAKNSKVTGSPETDLYTEYTQKITGFKAEGDNFKKNYDKSMMDALSITDQEEKNKKFEENKKSYDEATMKIDEAVKAYRSKLIIDNPNLAVSALIARGSFHDLSVEEIGNYLSKLNETSNKNPNVISIREDFEYRKKIDIGQKFIDLKLKDTTGNDIALSDFAGKGKYVLVDFWASDCTPCRRGNPKWVELYAKYKDKGFEIVAISLDSKKDNWTKAINEDKLTWIHMSDLMSFNSEVAKNYMITGIPDYYLLDKEGVIIERALGGGAGAQKIYTKLEEIFGE